MPIHDDHPPPRSADGLTIEESARAIATAAAASGVTTQQAVSNLKAVLHALTENPSALHALARVRGRKFPGDRGYRLQHFKRCAAGKERHLW